MHDPELEFSDEVKRALANIRRRGQERRLKRERLRAMQVPKPSAPAPEHGPALSSPRDKLSEVVGLSKPEDESTESMDETTNTAADQTTGAEQPQAPAAHAIISENESLKNTLRGAVELTRCTNAVILRVNEEIIRPAIRDVGTLGTRSLTSAERIDEYQRLSTVLRRSTTFLSALSMHTWERIQADADLEGILYSTAVGSEDMKDTAIRQLQQPDEPIPTLKFRVLPGTFPNNEGMCETILGSQPQSASPGAEEPARTRMESLDHADLGPMGW